QAMRAGQIIRRLRDFVVRGESEKRIESIAKLIEESGALGLTGAREQGVNLLFDLDHRHDLVLVDRVQIQQVLVNLFRNALEAMAATKQRRLVASTKPAGDDMIEVSVSDTGHGFADGVEPNLFQTFFTTKETGMGVGLSISRSIVEAHGAMSDDLVVVIDDDVSVRRALGNLLDSVGLTHLACAAPEDLSEADLAGRPACLVLD
ncbi:hypothetical protein KXW36_009623, partial [Aspergillus fumigatus]